MTSPRQCVSYACKQYELISSLFYDEFCLLAKFSASKNTKRYGLLREPTSASWGEMRHFFLAVGQ